MDKCEICQAVACDTHHIQEQHTADINGMIGNFHKNSKFNLVALCKSCHHNVHHGNLDIRGYIQTSDGIKLDYSFIEGVGEPIEEEGELEPIINHEDQENTNPEPEINIQYNTEPFIIINNPSKRKKFNLQQQTIIRNCYDKLKYKNLADYKNELFTIHNYKIGISTLKKILNNEY
jgi:hypothetical protein